MSEDTITLPASLSGWFGGDPKNLRSYADEVDRHFRNAYGVGAGAAYPFGYPPVEFMRWVAGEIEKQKPRKPGWYHAESPTMEAVLYWTGSRWQRSPNGSSEVRGYEDYQNSDVKFTPVTIGG